MRFRLVPLAAALWAALPISAGAQSICGDRSAVVAGLAVNYGERLRAKAVTAGGQLLEIFVAPGGVTWTLLVTSPRAMSCLIAHGDGWQDAPPPRPRDAPS